MIKSVLEFFGNLAMRSLCIVFCIYVIMLLLNANHMLTDEFKHLILGESLLIRSLQPVRESHPLVFSCLETAILLDHLEPLLRSSLLLLDSLYGLGCIGNKDCLVVVDSAEGDATLLRDDSLVEVAVNVTEDARRRSSAVILHICHIIESLVCNLQDYLTIVLVDEVKEFLPLFLCRSLHKVDACVFRKESDCSFVHEVSKVHPTRVVLFTLIHNNTFYLSMIQRPLVRISAIVGL